jgi:hypothetical protein
MDWIHHAVVEFTKNEIGEFDKKLNQSQGQYVGRGDIKGFEEFVEKELAELTNPEKLLERLVAHFTEGGFKLPEVGEEEAKVDQIPDLVIVGQELTKAEGNRKQAKDAYDQFLLQKKTELGAQVGKEGKEVVVEAKPVTVALTP